MLLLPVVVVLARLRKQNSSAVVVLAAPCATHSMSCKAPPHPTPHATATSCVSFVAVILWVLLREMKLFTPLSYAREPSDVAGISLGTLRKILNKILFNMFFKKGT